MHLFAQNTNKEIKMELVLKTRGLTKKYKNFQALRGVDMNVERGDIYGFVGENGSGKTTVIRIISGVIFANEGEFELFGKSSNSNEILAARSRIGAVVESPSIYSNLTAYDNLKMQAIAAGVEDLDKIRQVLADVGLEYLYSDKKKAGNFSLGMRQRLGIAMALLSEPEFIMLDEPMNGLDPAGIIEVRELILRLNREKGITFLISSHILTELALVATKYGIISKGKIIKEITSEELKRECRRSTLIKVENIGELLAHLSGMGFEVEATCEGVRVYGDVELNDVFSHIIGEGIRILGVVTSDFSIEDYYLSVVGGAGND